MLAPLAANFPAGTRAFVEPMFLSTTDPELRDWVLNDMAAAPPFVALSALEEMGSQHEYGDAARIFEGLHVPIIAVNSDLWPIDMDTNRRHMGSFEAIVLKGSDHFLMLDHPARCNQALIQAIHTIVRTQAQPKKQPTLFVAPVVPGLLQYNKTGTRRTPDSRPRCLGTTPGKETFLAMCLQVIHEAEL